MTLDEVKSEVERRWGREAALQNFPEQRCEILAREALKDIKTLADVLRVWQHGNTA